MNKIKTRTQLQKKCRGVEAWLRRNRPDLLDKYLPMVPIWTKEACIKEAQKYKTVTKWQKCGKGSGPAYLNGWIKDCTKHMDILNQPKWDKNACKLEALKYKSRQEWRDKQSRSYSKSCENGWLNEFTKHMPLPSNRSTKVINLDTGEIFTSAQKASFAIKLNKDAVGGLLRSNGKEKTAGGYRWAYCDENGNVIDKKKK